MALRKMTSLLASAAALALLAAGTSPAAAQGKEITFATWGGAFGKAFETVWTKPFEDETGIKVKMIFGGSLSNKQKVIAEAANPQIDVLTMVTGDAIDAFGKGVTIALDPAKISNISQIFDIGVKKTDKGEIYGAGLWVTAFGIATRPDKLDMAITSWDDLGNPKLKNKLGLPSPKYSNSHFVWWMSHLAGSPFDASKGYDKIKATYGSNVILEFDASVDVVQKLSQGEIWAAPILDITANNLVKQGVPVKFFVPKEGGAAGVDVIAQVKGSPNPEGAAKFINFIIDKARAEAACNELIVKCVNKNAEVAANLKDQIISNEAVQRLVAPDEEKVNAMKASWLESWSKEITPLTRR